MNQNLTIVSESFLETINEKQDKIISLLQDGKLGSQNDFITGGYFVDMVRECYEALKQAEKQVA